MLKLLVLAGPSGPLSRDEALALVDAWQHNGRLDPAAVTVDAGPMTRLYRSRSGAKPRGGPGDYWAYLAGGRARVEGARLARLGYVTHEYRQQ